jgi:hypothetical protein
MTSIENPMGNFIICYISFCSKFPLLSIKSEDEGFVCTVNDAFVYYAYMQNLQYYLLLILTLLIRERLCIIGLCTCKTINTVKWFGVWVTYRWVLNWCLNLLHTYTTCYYTLQTTRQQDWLTDGLTDWLTDRQT